MGVNWSTNRRAICSGTNIARDVPSMLMRASALTLPPTLGCGPALASGFKYALVQFGQWRSQRHLYVRELAEMSI